MPIRLPSETRVGETWWLDLDADPVVLWDASGAVVRQYPPAEAMSHFQMPSFSKSIKFFGIHLDGKLHVFDVSPEDLRQIRAFENRMVVSAGPEAVSAVRRKAWRDLGLGTVGTLAGTGMTAASYWNAARKADGGEYTVLYGLVIAGLVFIGKGIYGLNRHAQLKQFTTSPAKSPEQESSPGEVSPR